MPFTKESARKAALKGVAKYYRPFRERLLAKITMKMEGCWLWTGATHAFGYGVICVRHGKGNMVAHRAMWIEHNGPIPDGLQVLHKCDNPPCCNPDHLFLGTKKDNMQDMISKGRQKHDKGEKASKARLTERDVVDLRRLALGGIARKELERIYGLTKSGVAAIIRRRAWKHVL